jgi:hypothetical protein
MVLLSVDERDRACVCAVPRSPDSKQHEATWDLEGEIGDDRAGDSGQATPMLWKATDIIPLE